MLKGLVLNIYYINKIDKFTFDKVYNYMCEFYKNSDYYIDNLTLQNSIDLAFIIVKNTEKITF